MSDEAKWYVVHTYSGYENTVKATIEKYVENRGLQDLIHEISIPLETVTEITDNGPKEVDRKVFPGYVLVKMVMTDECWHIVRNIRGVTGFLGSGNKPIPLSESDGGLLLPPRLQRGGLRGGRQRQDHRWRPGVLPGHSGGDRPGPQQGPCGGVHVWTGDPRGAGAGPGGAC